MPDTEARREITALFARDYHVDHTAALLDEVATRTEGMSGGDIRSVFRDVRSAQQARDNAGTTRLIHEFIAAKCADLRRRTPALRPRRRVLVSYVREDAEMIDRIAANLVTHGIDVWLDRTHIAPGERWQLTIRNAIRDGNSFLACSSPSYAKRGTTYMNEELSIAVEQLRLMPVSQRWFIPMILEPCQISDLPVSATETLSSFQHVDFSYDWDAAMSQLVKASPPDPDAGREQDRAHGRLGWRAPAPLRPSGRTSR